MNKAQEQQVFVYIPERKIEKLIVQNWVLYQKLLMGSIIIQLKAILVTLVCATKIQIMYY